MRTSWMRRLTAVAGAAVAVAAGIAGTAGTSQAATGTAGTSQAATGTAGVSQAATRAAGGTQATSGTAGRAPRYQATIVRTAYGVPHITARNFGSLGYGFGFAFASDNLCTMANDYVTVEGRRSRYFGAGGSGQPNVVNDIYWQSVIDSHVIPKLLAVRSGPGALGPQIRQLVSGYVAGYNGYLASVGGAKGVPDPTCRGRAWVRPISVLDAYLRFYQVGELQGGAALTGSIAGAQPPTASSPAGRPAAAQASAARARALGQRLAASRRSAQMGSNAVAIGAAGTRDGGAGILLGNPHFPWTGPNRFYQMQLTIPGVLNVEGAGLYGIPLVLIGFNSSLAWSHTVAPTWPFTLFQLTLVAGHPTEYTYGGKPEAMTSQAVTVQVRSPGGTLTPVQHTVWSSRYGLMINSLEGTPLPWTSTTAYSLADSNATNLRFLSQFLVTDEAHSVPQEVSILDRYEGLPWVNTVATDSAGHALFADIQSVPDVTDAEAARCDTAVGKVLFAEAGLPVLDGSRTSCQWGHSPGAAAPGLFSGRQQPMLARRDFVENSNDSYWMTNPAHPLTGFPRIIGNASGEVSGGGPEQNLGLRTRSALTMILSRIHGTDGLGPAGFTFTSMKNLLYSDIQFGASLVKPQLVTMCRSFPGGMAPTRTGSIAVGDSCRVLAAWNGRENPDSRGAVLFREFWQRALGLKNGPWSHPFDVAHPVTTPYGLDTASPGVQQAFGNALAAMTAAHLPYGAPLSTVQYALSGTARIPVPGGPGDPLGEFNAVYPNGSGVVVEGSSYIQVVTWRPGDSCPEAATLLTYSESANPDSAHHADQTELFSHRGWATGYFCPAAVRAHAVSTTVVHGR